MLPVVPGWCPGLAKVEATFSSPLPSRITSTEANETAPLLADAEEAAQVDHGGDDGARVIHQQVIRLPEVFPAAREKDWWRRGPCTRRSGMAQAEQPRAEDLRRMFRTLSDFISDITGGSREAQAFDENDYRLAAAALLVHVMSIDGAVTDDERIVLKDILATRFGLDAQEGEALVELAIAKDAEAVDLYAFTSVLNRALDDEGRLRIVEMMFEVAYADGGLSEFEDNLVWRAAELLNVGSRDRIRIRREVREETETGGERQE
ncbi:TerB family tellurite resistance protein [Xanthobacter autotrophicus DSM 431]|uniref:tellurite resistance TerB family protein n=1 Tax=Xanthobacter nonsaccharivorans TaxID=3119912 RepID=UPI0037289789